MVDIQDSTLGENQDLTLGENQLQVAEINIAHTIDDQKSEEVQLKTLPTVCFEGWGKSLNFKATFFYFV